MVDIILEKPTLEAPQKIHAETEGNYIFHFNPWNNKVFLTLFLSKSPGMCYHIVCGKEEPEPPRHHAGRSRSERQRTIL